MIQKEKAREQDKETPVRGIYILPGIEAWKDIENKYINEGQEKISQK